MAGSPSLGNEGERLEKGAAERQGRGLCAGLLAVERKKKIKGEGRPAYVNKGREACGRPCYL